MLGQGQPGIGIEAPAVHGITMNRPIRGCIDVDMAAGPGSAAHAHERVPEACVVLEHGGGHDKIETVVLNRKVGSRIDYMIDRRPFFQIQPSILGSRRRGIPKASVDVE